MCIMQSNFIIKSDKVSISLFFEFIMAHSGFILFDFRAPTRNHIITDFDHFLASLI